MALFATYGSRPGFCNQVDSWVDSPKKNIFDTSTESLSSEELAVRTSPAQQRRVLPHRSSSSRAAVGELRAPLRHRSSHKPPITRLKVKDLNKPKSKEPSKLTTARKRRRKQVAPTCDPKTVLKANKEDAPSKAADSPEPNLLFEDGPLAASTPYHRIAGHSQWHGDGRQLCQQLEDLFAEEEKAENPALAMATATESLPSCDKEPECIGRSEEMINRHLPANNFLPCATQVSARHSSGGSSTHTASGHRLTARHKYRRVVLHSANVTLDSTQLSASGLEKIFSGLAVTAEDSPFSQLKHGSVSRGDLGVLVATPVCLPSSTAARNHALPVSKEKEHDEAHLKSKTSVHNPCLVENSIKVPSLIDLCSPLSCTSKQLNGGDEGSGTWSSPINLLSKHLSGVVLADTSSTCVSQPAVGTASPATDDTHLSPRQQILKLCGQSDVCRMTDVLTKSMLSKANKVGEGTFGEVFSTVNDSGQDVAIKIVPIEGSQEVNGEPQKTFAEMVTEVVVSCQLASLHQKPTASRNGHSNSDSCHTTNFIRVYKVSCCQGCYPRQLLRQWDQWDKQHSSENDRPSMFKRDQLYLLFEFAHGGKDLEHTELDGYQQAVSVFQQVTLALAVAEQALLFEHRDLHWGNILLGPCKEGTVDFVVRGNQFCVPSHSCQVSIIDFTLSRLTQGDCTVFCDVSSDDSLFQGKGDFQFEVYRLMRALLKNDWSRFDPATNVFWLRYLADKLLNEVTYRLASRSKAERTARTSLQQVHKRLQKNGYSSAWQMACSDHLFSSIS